LEPAFMHHPRCRRKTTLSGSKAQDRFFWRAPGVIGAHRQANMASVVVD
jgi:hypothetical protein